jgi:hypothetical protein
VDRPDLGFSVPESELFDAVQPAAGAGLRIMLDRQARMNLAVDAAWGRAGSGGVYLSVGEAF